MIQPAECPHCGGHDWGSRGMSGWWECQDCWKGVPPWKWVGLMKVAADKLWEEYESQEK